MRHQKKGFKLNRTASHRKATMQAMSTALIAHKRIRTTFTKAKALRQFVEPIITRAKEDTTMNRRQAFRYLQDKEAVKTLFGEIAEKVGDRPGGYTRIIKLGERQGDGAEMAIIELVDYNDVKPEGSSKGRRTRRSGSSRRRRGGSKQAATAAKTETTTQEEVVNQPVGGDETPSVTTETVEKPVAPEVSEPVAERGDDEEKAGE